MVRWKIDPTSYKIIASVSLCNGVWKSVEKVLLPLSISMETLPFLGCKLGVGKKSVKK
jgi:hypothetical protein